MAVLGSSTGASLERRLYLPYSAAQIFDLVADVERYPEFVPGWREVRVVSRKPDGLTVEQHVTAGVADWRFFTEARLDRPHTIHIEAVDAPFGKLAIRWTFEPLDAAGCAADFHAVYDLGDGALRRLAARPFERGLLRTVYAFERRARALYGAPF